MFERVLITSGYLYVFHALQINLDEDTGVLKNRCSLLKSDSNTSAFL